MNNKQVSIAVLGVLILGVLAWWLWSSPKGASPLVGYPQMAGGKCEGVNDPRWAKTKILDKIDPSWQGRVRIKFYGKIIDQNNKPIEGAEASFTWTDLSPNGASSAKSISDANGQFKLENVRGKNLGVHVSKEGYLPLVENRSRFEYAGFWEDTFHEPDPNKPVIFKLRKKGKAEPLLHREGEFTVSLGQRGTLNLDGHTQLGVTLTSNGEIREKNWSAQLDMTGGGIQASADEFPFEAPVDGYKSQLIIDLTTPKPSNWNSGYAGGLFYFKTTDGKYGRLELRTIPGKTFMRYLYYINPSGSRNLEFDPAK